MCNNAGELLSTVRGQQVHVWGKKLLLIDYQITSAQMTLNRRGTEVCLLQLHRMEAAWFTCRTETTYYTMIVQLVWNAWLWTSLFFYTLTVLTVSAMEPVFYNEMVLANLTEDFAENNKPGCTAEQAIMALGLDTPFQLYIIFKSF